MRIAQIAPLTESVPPRTYGGTERVVSFLTEELVAMGHDVTLFASGDSVTSAELESGWPCALRFDRTLRDPMAPFVLQMEQVLARAHEFDILHCHLDYWPFSMLSRQKTPFLTTLHGRLDLPELTPVYDLFPEAPLVSISDAQRRPLPRGNFVDTVYHGLPDNLLTPRPVKRDYLAFLGRICPEKSPDRAIACTISARCSGPGNGTTLRCPRARSPSTRASRVTPAIGCSPAAYTSATITVPASFLQVQNSANSDSSRV